MPDYAVDYGTGLQVTMQLYEGNFTRVDVIGDLGVVKEWGTYSEPITKSMYVIVYTGSDFTVRAVTAEPTNKSPVIGKVVTTPEGSTPKRLADGSNTLSPGDVWTWSSGKQGTRYATVDWINGKAIRQVVILEASKPGALVRHAGGGTFSTVNAGTLSTAPNASTAWPDFPVGILLESSSAGSTKSVLFF